MREGGLFKNLEPRSRAILFYCICIWIRLAIAYGVYKFAKYNVVVYVVLLFSVLAIYLNFSKLNQKVWWNRLVHVSVSIILFICSILVVNKYIKNNILGYIMLFDVLFGIMYSLYIQPFYTFANLN